MAEGSSAPYTSLNLGDHVGDDPLIVKQNRALVRRFLPGEPRWLKQVHGTKPIKVDGHVARPHVRATPHSADAPAIVCAVLVADCLPILLCDRAGTVVGLIHAGLARNG